MRTYILSSTLLLFIALTSGCMPNFHYTGPIEVQVIDAVSGKPVSGVVAVAEWGLYDFLPGYRTGSAEFRETVSDKNGYIRFSSLGPKFYIFRNAFSGRNPMIYLYVKNYRVTKFSIKDNSISYYGVMKPDKQKERYKVELQPEVYKGLSEKNVLPSPIVKLIEYMEEEDRCAWKNVPKMISIISNWEKKYPITNGDRSNGLFKIIKEYKCGDPKVLLSDDITHMSIVQ